MAEEESAPAEQADGATPEPADSDGVTPENQSQPTDPAAKAVQEERRARKVAERRAAELAAKVKEYEEKGLSEQEKLARQAQEFESRATQAETRLMQFEVAQAKGLSAAQAKYLSGTTRKELEARADEILADFPVQRQGGFVPMYDQGARGNGAPKSDMNSIIRQAAGYS